MQAYIPWKFVWAFNFMQICSMNYPWRYESESHRTSDKGYYVHIGDQIHAVWFSVDGTISAYEISLDQVVTEQLHCIEMSASFSVIPKDFLGIEIPGIRVNTISELETGIYLAYEGKDHGFHWMQGVYLLAKNVAEKHKQVAYFWTGGNQTFIVVFKDGKLQLANSFSTSNIAEMVYFVSASMHDSGLESLRYHLLANVSSTLQGQLLHEFERLGIQVTAVHQDVEVPGLPMQDKYIAQVLLSIPSCGLPEAI